MNFIGKLLPVHGYRVIFAKDLTNDYQLSLSHLYQPLIGMEATMLYQTLLNESILLDDETVQTHHTLMNYLNSPLDTIYKERLKLEAIGLLKTYETIHEQQKVFTYVMQSPFVPKDFFQDPMLSQLLYHHVGAKMFSKIKENLTGQPLELNHHQEITASFSDVFNTYQQIEPDHNQMTANIQVVDSQSDRSQSIDFSWLETVLSQRMIPSQQVLTPVNKRIIHDMMQLYNLAAHDIEKCFLWALTEDHQLDHEEFKIACHDLFKAERNKLIHLQAKQPIKQEAELSASKSTTEGTKMERLVERLETISLRQLLEGTASGQASAKELKMLRDIMTTYGLKPAVMNVLVHYVLIQSNMKLSEAYLETIASHWSRAKLTTAAEAMEFVRKEIEKAQQRKNRRTTGRHQSKEVIPEWFKQQKEQRKQTTAKENSTIQNETYDENEILALFHKHSSENKNIQG